MTKLTKDEVISDLRSMVEPRLLDGKWPISAEEVPAVNERFIELGLMEEVDAKGWRDTDLGVDVNLRLWNVFIGWWDLGEHPSILWDNGLIDKAGYDGLCDTMIEAQIAESSPPGRYPVDKWGSILCPVVRAAYLQYQAERMGR